MRGRPSREVSFVVIAYNEERNIARTLTAIAGLRELGDYEIVVVNDGSRDGTAEIVAQIAAKNARVKLIDLLENKGRGFARHRGVAAATGDLIAMVDADIVLPVDWFVHTRKALDGHHAVGGTPVPDADAEYVYRRFGLTPRVVGATATVTGSNGLYLREVFDVITFDESLREGEDTAFNHLMERRGMSCLTVPGLVVDHSENKNFGTSLRWLFTVGKGATRQLIRYRQIRKPDVVAVGFIAVLIGCVVAGIIGQWAAGPAIVVGFFLVVSTQHLRTRFLTPLSQWRVIALALAVDCIMLTSYLVGRLAGFSALGERPDHVHGSRAEDR
jgi:glycosyltransferase involved in cell wall biosynthesis